MYETNLPATMLAHLRGCREPFVLRRGSRGPEIADADVHLPAFVADTELYALSALAPNVARGQRARVLFTVLGASRRQLSTDLRDTLDRVAERLLVSLPADDVLKVFLALRRARANHKHTSRAILRYVFDHPSLGDLAARRRNALVDCVEHALGRDTARGAAKRLGENGASPLARFLDDDVERAGGTMTALFERRTARSGPVRLPKPAGIFGKLLAIALGRPTAPSPEPRTAPVPAVSPEHAYERAHERFAAALDRAAEIPKTVTVTNRGDVAATLAHVYRGGATRELLDAVDRYADMAAEGLPRFGGSVALVLDASASTRGYGEREFACVSQSVALRLVMERCCADLRVVTAGGAGEPPVPQGATDLAGPLLDALEGEPDLAVVVTDGYENARLGDLARVVEALPRAGVRTPVAVCVSAFGPADDLTLRRPMPGAPQFTFWHEQDFDDLLLSLFALAGGDAGRAAVRDAMYGRLARPGEEAPAWIDLT